MRTLWLPHLLILSLAACGPAPVPQSGFAYAGIEQPLPLAMLDVHNRERRAFGSPPLAWDPAIAAGAAIYARELARLGRLQHSSKAFRPGQGENLWMGTRGGYPYAVMAEAWASEQRRFRPGRFPAVSTTRNWADVGHFTAMVWPTTTRLGCGLAGAGRWDILVCRYAPAGNVDGVILVPR